MKSKFDGLMWGLILIVAGSLFLAYNLGYDINLTPVFWMGACALLSAAWFIRYFFSDHKRWGWLCPPASSRPSPSSSGCQRPV